MNIAFAFCMSLRFMLAYYAMTNPKNLALLGTAFGMASVGIMNIYLFNLRPIGIETGGKAIWWNSSRPVHAVLWALFAAMAISGSPKAWKVLFADGMYGLANYFLVRPIQ
jgi:hypothetical protein